MDGAQNVSGMKFCMCFCLCSAVYLFWINVVGISVSKRSGLLVKNVRMCFIVLIRRLDSFHTRIDINNTDTQLKCDFVLRKIKYINWD